MSFPCADAPPAAPSATEPPPPPPPTTQTLKLASCLCPSGAARRDLQYAEALSKRFMAEAPPGGGFRSAELEYADAMEEIAGGANAVRGAARVSLAFRQREGSDHSSKKAHGFLPLRSPGCSPLSPYCLPPPPIPL